MPVAQPEGPPADFDSPEQKRLFWAAATALGRDDLPQTIALATEALRITRTPALAGMILGLRGLARWRSGDSEGAIPDLSRAIEAQPQQPEYWLVRAAAHQANKDHGLALADFDEAIRLDPRTSDAYRARALCRLALDDLSAAAADIDRALELEPSDADLRAAQSTLRERLMGPPAREERGHFTVGVAFNNLGADRIPVVPPNESPETVALNEALARKDWSRVVQLSSEQLPKAIGPKAGLWHACRGFARSKGGDHRGAVEDYTRALELQSGQVEILWMRAVSQQALRNYGGALADLNEAIRLAPASDLPYASRAIVHLQREERDKALADVNRLVALRPNDPRALITRAGVCLDFSPEQSVADATAALALDPGNPQTFLLRAKAYQDLGREAESKADLAAAEKLGLQR